MTTQTTTTVKQRLDATGLQYSKYDLSEIGTRVYQAWTAQHPSSKPEKVDQKEGRFFFQVCAYPADFLPQIDLIAQFYFDEQLAALLEANRLRVAELEKQQKETTQVEIQPVMAAARAGQEQPKRRKRIGKLYN